MTSNNHKFWSTYYKIRYYQSITAKQTKDEINLIREFIPLLRYKNVLDFVCGFGRHSIGLAKLGYNVEGFDIDEGSIKQAQALIKKQKLGNIKIYKQDSVTFNKKDHFDAAICLYSSIGFLDEKSNEKSFKNLFDSVNKKGRIILDLMNPDWAISKLKPYTEKRISFNKRDYLIKHNREILYNPVREKNTISIVDIAKGKRYKTSYILRLYTFDELNKKIKENGFRVYKKFGSFRKDRISLNQERIITIMDRIN
jgi:SAM-dependent methyltransferase